MPYPGLLHPEPLPCSRPLRTLPPQETLNTVLSQSLWGLWVLVHTRYAWALWGSLEGMGFDSKPSQSYVFSRSHVWMWELDYEESWALKNWYFWTVVLKTLESPLACKDSQPAHPKGNQSWAFIGRTDAEAETPILWSPDVMNWTFEKTLMLGKIEGRRKRWQQRMRWLDGIIDSMDVSLSSYRSWWWTGRPGVLQSVWSQRVIQDSDFHF